jgi:DNA-binding beta-propeller fold protein YncE
MGPDRLIDRVVCRPIAPAAWLAPLLMSLAACGVGGGEGTPQAPQSPLTTPMALVVNQDDATLSVLRLDGKGSPLISTVALEPAQSQALQGVAFSLGEWIFVTQRAGHTVATIDPLGSLTPTLESYLAVGTRPGRIYRDPTDQEVLWVMNDGDAATGLDAVHCQLGGSVSVLHNSHLAPDAPVPHVIVTTCLVGTGAKRAAFASPTASQPGIPKRVFISHETTGVVSMVQNEPSDLQTYLRLGAFIDLCDSAKEQALGRPACDGSFLTPNVSNPQGLSWSAVTGKIYSYQAGYGTVVEIDPTTLSISRTLDLSGTSVTTVGITPDRRFLFLLGRDISDPDKVIGILGVVSLDTPQPSDPLTATLFAVPQLEHVSPSTFRFTPDGSRLYLGQSNDTTGLTAGQAANLKKDRLLVFDPSTLPAAPTFVAEVALPAAEAHSLDVWSEGAQGAGAPRVIVVTNGTAGATGSVSLIDAGTHAVGTPIPVGGNPGSVTVYYYGLAASGNQATPSS